MFRGTKRRYKNRNRTFVVNTFKTDKNGYFEVTDIDTNVIFYLPKFVIEDMEYVFSWNRYEEEYDIKNTYKAFSEIFIENSNLKTAHDAFKFMSQCNDSSIEDCKLANKFLKV